MKRSRLIVLIAAGVGVVGGFLAAVLPVVAGVVSMAGVAAVLQGVGAFFAARGPLKKRK